jgi:glyoxylase-like metal-dependent hydrolase (beta-lactamase superfamily II)
MRMHRVWKWKYCAAVIALHAAAAGVVRAETDLSGEWVPRYHEDLPERIPGPALGEYHGIPINEAARRRAESWSASMLSVLEHQCVPHPADYATRGPSHMRIWKELDRPTQQLVAIRIHISAWGTERTIWMDGRAHPPPYAAHTWQGFSTGVWNGNMLTVTTTHLKPAFIRRNGVPRSEGAVLREHFIRHGEHLTHISVVQDPAYLTEPFIRSQSWVLSPYQVIAPYPCDPAEEGSLPRHAVPHYLPGQNPYLREYAEQHQLPLEGVMGGARTMYPEFIEGKDRLGVAGAPVAGSPTALARQVNILHVRGSVYMLHTPRGNMTVQAGDDGIVIVDALGAELADEIYAAIAPLSARSIRYIVNTNAHESHTGGNGELAARGRSIVGGNVVAGVDQDALSARARIVAHENALLSMTTAQPPREFRDWPTDVFFSDRKDLYFNGEGVQISHLPAARTNGDSIVYFRQSDVISTGAIFRTDAFPFIDLEAGGSVQGVIDGLNAVIDLAIPAFLQEGGTMIVPGRGRLADESDVVEYRDMVVIVRDRIRDGIDRGLSLQQIQATRPTLGYDWQYGRSDDGWTGDDFVAVVYRDLIRAR